MKKLSTVILSLLLFCLFAAVVSGQQHSVKPKQGFVPTKEVAVLIAEAVLTPVYGAKEIGLQKPLNAKLQKGVWLVTGSIKGSKKVLGGVAEVWISKSDARVIRMTHGK